MCCVYRDAPSFLWQCVSSVLSTLKSSVTSNQQREPSRRPTSKLSGELVWLQASWLRNGVEVWTHESAVTHDDWASTCAWEPAGNIDRKALLITAQLSTRFVSCDVCGVTVCLSMGENGLLVSPVAVQMLMSLFWKAASSVPLVLHDTADSRWDPMDPSELSVSSLQQHTQTCLPSRLKPQFYTQLIMTKTCFIFKFKWRLPKGRVG